MAKPTEAEVKELWKLCGFRCVEGWWWSGYRFGNALYYSKMELPPIDLNNLFKWAVPKLDMPIMLSTLDGETEAILPSYFPDEEDLMSEPLSVKDKDPALALFWACYKVLKED